MSVAPNDPAVVAGLSDNLSALIAEFKTYVDGWQQRVDAVVVRLQNAGASEPTPDGGTTGQVPPGVIPPEPVAPPVETPPVPSTEPTGSSTPPEDTGTVHDFRDPSSDDTITDPSGDDVQL